MATAPTPVTLLTGFLGAGKTTLLNRLLTSGQRIAVVVNEFGDLPIDGALVVGAEEDVIELRSGCLCCTVRGDLQRTVAALLARRRRWVRPARFDRLVIETSGLASPGPVLQTFLLDEVLSAQTTIDGVVTVAHAGHLLAQLANNPETEEQLAYADAVLLNHTDTVDDEVVDAAESAIVARNPMAQIHRTARAAVPLAAVLDIGGHDTRRWRIVDGARPVHTAGVSALSMTSAEPVDLHRLKVWLQFLASRKTMEIMRIKGILCCAGRTREVIVQGVYQWLSLGPGPGGPPAVSRLVIIGRDLDAAEIERGWAAVRHG